MPFKTIIDWMTDTNSCFLFGSGTSKCAGLPLMDELTEKIKGLLKEESRKLLENIKGPSERPATIEDLMNHFIQMYNLLFSQKNPQDKVWSVGMIELEIKKIQESIVKELETDWKSNEIHKRLLSMIASYKGRKTCDLFTLNYDTILEASLEDLKIPYIDGFNGADNAFFDSDLFNVQLSSNTYFKLYKLHGSINWIRDNDETVRRKYSRLLGDNPRVLIYPAEQKYFQTQYGVYEYLMNFFRKRLRENRKNNKLIVLGYSFSDEHINVAIQDSILSRDSNLTVYAFVGQDKNDEAQVSRLEDMVKRCDKRLNVMIGNHCFLGSALEDEDWNKVKDRDLWKFENIVKLLEGGAN